MRKSILLLLPLAIGLSVACEELSIEEPTTQEPTISIEYAEQSLADGSVIEVYRGESAILDYSASAVSKITASASDGWSASVSMSKSTITISAPSVDDSYAPTETDITLSLYDGSGSEPMQKTLKAKALYHSMEFALLDDISSTISFSLGAQKSFSYSANSSVKQLNIDLPLGWKVDQYSGGFTITAPDLSIEEGATSGNVVVTPISWEGESLSSVSIAVEVSFESTFQFEDSYLSFAYGETKTLNVIVKGIKSIDTPVLPEGWTGDFSNIKQGSISLTAPSSGASSSVFSLSGISFDDSAIQSTEVLIRLFGINDLAELLAFRDAYGATANEPVLTGHEKYMRDGELCLNADITLDQSTIEPSIKAYFIKYLALPLNGCGHTLSVDYTISNKTVAAIFQYADGVKVHDLNLSGSMSLSTASSSSFCSGFVATANAGTLFENITNSVDVSFSATASAAHNSYVSAFAGRAVGRVTMKNCKYTGTLTLNSPSRFVAGFIGQGDSSKPGEYASFTDCEFAGQLIYSQGEDASQHIRLGGILGDAARKAECVRCKFTGSMIFNLSGKKFITGDGRGVGGIIGRITAPASGYVMDFKLTDCSNTGSIVVNNPIASEAKTSYGQIIGSKPGTSADVLAESGSIAEGTITFNE